MDAGQKTLRFAAPLVQCQSALLLLPEGVRLVDPSYVSLCVGLDYQRLRIAARSRGASRAQSQG